MEIALLCDGLCSPCHDHFGFFLRFRHTGLFAPHSPCLSVQAWHAWALMNYKAVLFHKERISPPFSGTEPENGDTGTAAGGDALPLPTRHEPVSDCLTEELCTGVLLRGFVSCNVRGVLDTYLSFWDVTPERSPV